MMDLRQTLNIAKGMGRDFATLYGGKAVGGVDMLKIEQGRQLLHEWPGSQVRQAAIVKLIKEVDLHGSVACIYCHIAHERSNAMAFDLVLSLRWAPSLSPPIRMRDSAEPTGT
jgi:hypothetical protein